jgi:hypothetical protein
VISMPIHCLEIVHDRLFPNAYITVFHDYCPIKFGSTFVFGEAVNKVRGRVPPQQRISDHYFFIASGVGLSPLHCGHFWPIVPAPDDR